MIGTRKLGIDLGTVNVVVYAQGRGIVLREPSVAAVSKPGRQIVAVGASAYDMVGRTPDRIEISNPLRDGVIADYLVTEALLSYFVRRACGRLRVLQPDVVISVPAEATGVERRAVREAALAAGCRSSVLIPESLAAALGARLPVQEPFGSMIVNVGGGTAEIAILSLSGIVASRSLRVASIAFDEAIITYLRRQFNFLIGNRTAEQLKMSIGSATAPAGGEVVDIKGLDMETGLPSSMQIQSFQVHEALSDPLAELVRGVKSVLEQAPPEIAADIVDNGIVLSGGGCLLNELDTLISVETGIPCFRAEHPLLCVALGTGIALERFELIRRISEFD